MNAPKLLLAVLLLFAITRAPATPTDDAIAAVLAAEKARGAAMVASDMKTLGQILADDLIYTHSTGMQETKAAHLDSYAQGLRYTRFETSALQANVITPDVITLNGHLEQTKGREGKWKDFHLIFLAVWRRSATGAWQLVSLQTSLQTANRPAPATPPAPAAQ